MSIDHISVKNFRSFRDLDISFGKFNVLIGANAAGKSNFIQIVKFIRDLSAFGVDNAVQLQGGVKFLRNFNSTTQNSTIELLNNSIEEHIKLNYTDGDIGGSETSDLNSIQKIKIFDFNFDLAKSPSSIESKIELEENGENLPVVLMKILKNEDSRRLLLNYIQLVLTFIKDINTKLYFDHHLMINLKEIFALNKDLPGSMISDGTISIICMIIALFFDDSKITVFEEPDRSVHPQTHEKLVKLFYEASNEKQIFLTTHNPELLKYCRLEDIYLVSRDDDGASYIKKVTDYPSLKLFLDQDLGIDQIFCDLLLTD